MIIIYIMRPDTMKVNLFSKISVRNFRVKFQHHRCIKDSVLIPEIHQALVALGDRTDGGGSRAEPVMFGRAEPPIFLDRRMAAGIVNGDHDVTGILLGADADKRRAVRTSRQASRAFSRRLPKIEQSSGSRSGRDGGSWIRTEKSTDALRASSP